MIPPRIHLAVILGESFPSGSPSMKAGLGPLREAVPPQPRAQRSLPRPQGRNPGIRKRGRSCSPRGTVVSPPAVLVRQDTPTQALQLPRSGPSRRRAWTPQSPQYFSKSQQTPQGNRRFLFLISYFEPWSPSLLERLLILSVVWGGGSLLC